MKSTKPISKPSRTRNTGQLRSRPQAASATLQLLLALPPDTPCRLGLAVLLPAAAVARRTGALELQEAARKAQCAVCTLVVEAASG